MKKVAIALTLCVACLIGLMAAFPEDATRAAFAIERFRSGLEHKSIVMDGETWHYLDGGPTDAPVVLLLHGFGADKDNWTRFSKNLTDRYRVIAPDLPGFGESTRRLDRDYSLSAQSDWLHDFAAALKLDNFHLGGNSMGGHTAAFYAYRYSSQIESLLLIDNAGITSPNASEAQLAIERGEHLLLLSSVNVMRPLLPQAKVVIMQETGHIPMLERPQETAAHYLEFLGSL
jgi:abhydrolase domain-containing protein 6